MTTRSPYTVTAGHRCKVCGTVERVSKRAHDEEHVISEGDALLLTEGVTRHVMFGCAPDCRDSMLMHRIAMRVTDAVASTYQSVSEGASAPGSRDLPDEQALDRSQPSETDFKCDSCDRTSPTRAGIVAHQRSHAGTIGPTGESGD